MSKITAGEPVTIDFYYKSDPDTAYPITGFDALIQMRSRSRTGELIEEWNGDSDEVTIDAAAGHVSLTIPASVTRAYDWESAYIDCLLTDSDGTPDDGLRSNAVALQLYKGVTR